MNKSKRRTVSMGFSRENFQEGTHMCLIYSDEQERRRVMSKYVESGLLERENVYYFADTLKPDEVKSWLNELGVEVKIENDPLDIKDSQSTYCPNGVFSPEVMYDKLRQIYMECKSDSVTGARVTGEMGWALLGLPGTERLMEYESYVNVILAEHPITSVCQYDANRFDGKTILDALKVHPFMVVHGQIVRNPYYLTHDEFMKEFNSRE